MVDKKTIWVVEDSPSAMALMLPKLKASGHDIVPFTTTDKAEAEIKKGGKPDLLISDNLTAEEVLGEDGKKKTVDSKITGLQLIAFAKENGVEKTVLTSGSDHAEEAKNAGAIFVQKKDQNWPGLLRSRVEKIFEKKRVWVVGNSDIRNSLAYRIMESLPSKDYDARDFATAQNTLSGLSIGAGNNPALIVMTESGNEDYINEMQPVVKKAKEHNIPIIVISEKSAVTLSDALKIPALKDDKKLLETVEKELWNREVNSGNVGASRAK